MKLIEIVLGTTLAKGFCDKESGWFFPLGKSM